MVLTSPAASAAAPRLGAFAGSTPDPTAWNYKPNRQIAGVFANTEIGKFENVRITSTVGLAVTRLGWKAERQFAFTESSFSYKQRVSLYHNLEADQLVPGRLGNTESGAAISSSFFTARFQPVSWLTLDVNHNYFRTIPTFDLVLVGTGLARQVSVHRLEWRPALWSCPGMYRSTATSGRTNAMTTSASP